MIKVTEHKVVAKVSPEIIARRYARALYMYAGNGVDVDTVGVHLQAAAEAAGGRSLTEAQTIRLSAAAGLCEPVRKLLGLMARRRRSELLPLVAGFFTEAVDAAAKRVHAVVTVAAPLSEAQKLALSDQLAQISGATVQMTEIIDPAILGGFRAECAGLLVDASLQHRLLSAEQAMKGEY